MRPFQTHLFQTAYPSGTPQLDTTNSLTQGLIDAILPLGGMPISLAGSLAQSAFVNTAGPTNAVNYRYQAPVKVYASGTPSYSLRSSVPAPLATSQGSLKECAMAVLWRSDVATAATTFCFGYGNSGDDNPVFGVGIDGANTHLWAFLRDAAGTSQTNSGALIVAPLTDYLIILSHSEKGNFHRLYVNGLVDLSTTATTLGNASFNRTTLGALQRTGLGLASGGQMAMALAWNRALTPTEAGLLSSNPWQIFAPTVRTIFPFVAGTPPVDPIWVPPIQRADHLSRQFVMIRTGS